MAKENVCSSSVQILIVLATLYLVTLTPAIPLKDKQDHITNGAQEFVNSRSKIDISAHSTSSSAATCANVSCTLSFKDDDIQYFQTLIFDREALAIFVFVTISNHTSVPSKSKLYLSLGEQGKIVPYSLQLKEKWAWIRNRRAKFLATLPYDVDILSLTTLTKDVYNLILKVNSTPTDCYLNFTKACLKEQIAGGLMNLTQTLGDVCYKIENSANLLQDHGYSCCHKDVQGSRILCDRPIRDNIWVRYALTLLWVVSFAFGVLSPLLLKYLPKEFYKRGKPKNRPMRRSDSCASYDSFESSIIMSSKVLVAKGDGLLDISRSTTQSIAFSRICRCLFVILLSLLPILQTLLYVYLKKSEVGVSDELLGVGSAFVTLLDPSGKYALIALYCFCILLVAIAMAIPKTLSELARSLSGKKDEQTFLGFKKPDQLICHSDKRGFQLMYENMIFHLNCLMMISFWKYVWSIMTYPMHLLCRCGGTNSNFLDEEDEEYIDSEEKPGTAKQILRGIVLLLIFPIWLVIIISAFFLYLLPVTYVAFRIWKMLFKLEVECYCCEGIPMAVKILSLPILYILFIVFCICVEASYLMLALVISVNLVFLGSVIGFTTMGVLFYVDAYISYVVIIILTCYYIVRALHTFKIQFKRVKTIIFKECQDHDNDLKAEASIRDTFSGQANLETSSPTSSLQKLAKSIALVTHCDEKQVPSIPLNLFLSAQHEVFPFKRVIISKILGLLMVFTYLGLVFSFVMSLVEYNAAGSMVQSITILLLGAVPSLLLGNPHEIPEKQEKWIKFHVREQISKYCKRFA